jgi:hypothetical protein
MADQTPMAPDAQTGGIPRWVIYAGGAAALVGLYLWYRNNQANAAATATGTSGGAVAPVVDPSTGGLIDPNTGLPYIGTQPPPPTDNSGWLLSAEQAAAHLGYAPGLVDQALYNFLNGNALNAAQSGVINTLLGKVGYPPIQVPFLGTPPATTPTPKPPVKPPKVKLPIVKNPNPRGLVPLPTLWPGGPILWAPPNVLRTYFPGVAQHPTPAANPPKPEPQLLPTPAAASFISQVLAGRAPLPKGIATPAGYTLNPTTRFLRKTPARPAVRVPIPAKRA